MPAAATGEAGRAVAPRRGRAEPARVYEVPEGTRITYTLEKVLEAIQGLQLRVAPGATENGESSGAASNRPGTSRPRSRRRTASSSRPSARGAFRHATTPKGPEDRPELWRTHLTVRKDDGTFDDDDADQRIVRALWTRDDELPTAGLRPAADPVRPHRDRHPDPRRQPGEREDAARDGPTEPVEPRRVVRLEAVVGVPGRTSSTTGTRRSWAATGTCGWRTPGSCSRSGTAASW